MNLKISQRKAFLNREKEAGHRITIGFAGIADLRSFIALEYIEGMMKAAADYDINFINMGAAVKYSLFDDINFINHYMKNFQFMKKPFIDGLITWGSSLESFMDKEKVIRTFLNLKPLPIVDIGHTDIPDTTSLRIDSESSIQMMMEHLTKVHGYSKFAFFGADVSEPHRKRLRTYQNFLKENGIQEIENSIYMAKSMNIGDIASEVEKLLQNHRISEKQEIEAIITTTDILAAEIIKNLDKNNIKVPEDIAVTGFNNWYDGIISKTPITTISLEYFKRGYLAVELLIDKIMNPATKAETIRIKTSLIVRQSCGCFEKSVLNATKKIDLSSKSDYTENENESEEELRKRLASQIILIFKTESQIEMGKFIDAFFEDVYSNSEQSKMLFWFQSFLQRNRQNIEIDTEDLQDIITNLRNLLIPVIKNEKLEVILNIDGIFHQMRNLITVYSKYDAMAARENPYRMNNISQSAINLSDASTIEEITDLLKIQLNEMGISKAVLALCDKAYNIGEAKLSFVYPDVPQNLKEKLPLIVRNPEDFPKEFFSTSKRYSLMLEVLHYSDRYFGYIFLDMKSPNIAIYDVIRLLLGNALYSLTEKTKNQKFTPALNQSEIISSVIEDKLPLQTRSRITITQIKDFLIENIAEKTDIDKMAQRFMVSRSYITKKTKELTGCSIQELHEKMKIEQAKKLLLSDNFSINDISKALGFSNQNYFSNVFKKITGLSPKFWAERER